MTGPPTVKHNALCLEQCYLRASDLPSNHGGTGAVFFPSLPGAPLEGYFTHRASLSLFMLKPEGSKFTPGHETLSPPPSHPPLLHASASALVPVIHAAQVLVSSILIPRRAACRPPAHEPACPKSRLRRKGVRRDVRGGTSV